MTEERPTEDGAIARASDHGTGAPVAPVHPPAPPSPVSTVDDEIAVEEGEPESLSANPEPPPPAKVRESPRPLPLDANPLARGRRMLRIPDDEVSRPISAYSVPAPAMTEMSPVVSRTPQPFEASGGPPIAASRIITINPPPREDPPPEAKSSSFADVAHAPGISDSSGSGTPWRLQEDHWTPYQPTVEDVSVHDSSDADEGLGSDEPPVASAARDSSGPEIVVDEDVDSAPPPAAPTVADEITLESVPPPPRSSESGELAEVQPEDVVSIESPPLRGLTQKAVSPPPSVSPAVSKPQGPTAPGTSPAALPPRSLRPPPLLLVPGLASPLAPPPMNEASAASRRKARPWWEDLFNDDFIRTMAKVTDAQIATEVDFIEESLGLAKGAVVLDLACGTGRHAIDMTGRGYQVVGFDLSLAMLARAADEAQEREQKLNFVQGDMREMTFGETFDGVYVWNTSFGFFEEEKNSAVIANVHRALKPGGLLLLDVANRDFIVRQSPSLAWFEGDGCVCMDEMHVDWITSRMRVKRTMMLDDGRAKEIEYSIRIYALHELGKILHDQGFRVAEVSGGVATPGAFIGADSPRILVVAEKR
jgi:SAM-dependent methyltransferase